MPDVLIATDAPRVHDEVRQVLRGPDSAPRWARSGPEALAMARATPPELAILDMQVGSMGAMAIALELHLDEGMGDLPHIPVLMLLDRRADVFLARQAKAEGFVLKPLDPIRLRRAVAALRAGGTYEDETHRPATITR